MELEKSDMELTFENDAIASVISKGRTGRGCSNDLEWRFFIMSSCRVIVRSKL